MVIEWFGQGRFRLSGDDGNMWIHTASGGEDLPPGPATHVVALSDGPQDSASIDHTAPASHTPSDGPFLVRGPGEYEVHGIFVTAVTLYGTSGEADSDVGRLALNVLLDDVAVCHLPWPGAAPDKDQVELLGDIDVLLVPVGGESAPEPAGTAELVATLEPSIVVPMHFDPENEDHVARVGRFLAELGLETMDPLPRLQVERAQLPEDLQAAVLAATR